MFSRGNITSKYITYSRFLRGLKANFLKGQSNADNLNKKCKLERENISKIIQSWKITCTSLNDRPDNSNKSPKTSPKLFQEFNHRISRLLKSKYVLATGVVAAAPEGKTLVDTIPEPPPIPDKVEFLDVTKDIITQVNQVNELGEPSFASLGLGGMSPVGWVQNCFEYIHVSLGVPWWEAIVLGTLLIRFCLFPLVIVAQRNAAKMNNYMPQMQVLQVKMTEARQSGNAMDAAKYSQEMLQFMNEKGLNPLKNMLVPLVQAPVFISFFMALRKMANVPVESMREGGLWWFADLTIPDQYFILPIITSATLWLTIELGTDSARLSAQNLQTMRYVLRAIPVIMLPFVIHFPAAILCYWTANNFMSLAQVAFLRIPSVRDYFKIERLVVHNPENLPIKPKGFSAGLQDSWTNIKITKELEERRRIDEMQFQRAGKGPLVKTYKYDPTKIVNAKKN